MQKLYIVVAALLITSHVTKNKLLKTSLGHRLLSSKLKGLVKSLGYHQPPIFYDFSICRAAHFFSRHIWCLENFPLAPHKVSFSFSSLSYVPFLRMQFSCKSLLQLLKMFSLYEAVMNMACRIKWMEKKNFNSIVFGEMFTISLSFHNLILLSALLYYRKELCLPVCSLLSSTSNNNKYEWSISMSWYNLVNVNRPLLIYFQFVMNMQSIIYYF